MRAIKTYRVSKRGERGVCVSLPSSFVDFNGVKAGDEIEFFLIDGRPGEMRVCLKRRAAGSGPKVG